MAILALDIGEKKIGVAISETGLLANEFCTIEVKSEKTALGEIFFLIKRRNIDTVVIGLPKNMDGSSSTETSYIHDVAAKLRPFAKVVFEDETLTSKEAERILFGLGLTLEKVREHRDQMAAKLILDQYIDKKIFNDQ